MNPGSARFRLSHALLAGAWLIGFGAIAPAQTSLHLHGRVRDASGRSAQGATIFAEGRGGEVTSLTDANGRFQFEYPNLGALTLHATTHFMGSSTIHISAEAAAAEINLVLHPSSVGQQITVTATRSSIDIWMVLDSMK